MQNTRKNARRHHPHMARRKTKARPKRPRTIFIQIYIARNGSAEVTQARGRPSFPAHSAGRKNLRRTKCAAEVLSCPRTRRKGRLPRAGHTRQLMRRCKPVVLILDSTGLNTSQGLAKLLHHRTDLGAASREGHGLIGTVDLVVDLAHREMTAAVPHRPHSTKVPALTSAHSTGRWSTVMPDPRQPERASDG